MMSHVGDVPIAYWFHLLDFSNLTDKDMLVDKENDKDKDMLLMSDLYNKNFIT